MEYLRRIIERTDTVEGRMFDLGIQLLIILSLVTFSIETLPDLTPGIRSLLGHIEAVTVVIFTIEYALRIILAKNKIAFAVSFFGIVDLMAILPFYLASGIDLRSIRAFRLLRIVRILKLTRYSNAIQLFRRAMLLVKEELILFFFAAVIVLYLSAVGIYYFEHEAQPEAFSSVFDSMWWALATLTTVGYGDIYPVTAGGRWFTAGILLVGLGVVAVPTGLLASALSQARSIKDDSSDVI